MNHVTNVVLTVGCLDWRNAEAASAMPSLQAWLEANNHPKLYEISDHAAGPEEMEIELWAGAYNQLDDDAFVATFQSLAWQDLEEVVLVLAPHDGPHRTYRPNNPQ